LNALKRLAKRLRRAQRKLSRKQRGSANFKKQKRRLAKLGARAADARKDYLHKASSLIAKNHGVVVMEDLTVAAMSASAKGTAEQPARNVEGKAGLNRAMLDQGWFAFRSMLAWKLAERGGNLILVDPRNTSRSCRVCGHVATENRPTQAAFARVSCGHSEHADVNAAKNTLAAGLAASACGGTPRPAARRTRNQPEGRLMATAPQFPAFAPGRDVKPLLALRRSQALRSEHRYAAHAAPRGIEQQLRGEGSDVARACRAGRSLKLSSAVVGQ
jgi:putative transposase